MVFQTVYKLNVLNVRCKVVKKHFVLLRVGDGGEDDANQDTERALNRLKEEGRRYKPILVRDGREDHPNQDTERAFVYGGGMRYIFI